MLLALDAGNSNITMGAFEGRRPAGRWKRFACGSGYVSGKRVVVEQAGGAVRGTTAGLDPAGFLRVRRDDGTETLILAGGVRAAGT